MEMQSTSHRTITDYNLGAQRNISNPPQNNRQQLSLADLDIQVGMITRVPSNLCLKIINYMDAVLLMMDTHCFQPYVQSKH